MTPRVLRFARAARSTLLVLTVSLLAPLAVLQAQPSAPQSRLASNIPPRDSFDLFLQRDINSYFQVPGRPSSLAVKWELLKDASAQIGVGSPTYFMWVAVSHESTLLYEGAMRLAAIDGKEFTVLDFIPVQDIRSSPELLRGHFPAPLIANILARAGPR